MASYPLVLVDGPPRCGKSTVARQLASSSSAGAILARAGSPEGRRIMANPLVLSAAQPVILDGATREEARALERILKAQPWAVPPARSSRLPRFVLVGGPFQPDTGGINPEPAGTVMAHLRLTPLTLAEVGRGSVRTHWLRGGYPEAYAAGSDTAAMVAIEELGTGLSGGRLLPWSLPASPTRLATLLAKVAENGTGQVNEGGLARILDTSRPTVCRWMEGLEQAGILRKVPRLPGKGAHRTVQAPAWHIRDSGLAHGLLGISSTADLRSMPRLAAASWQAYVIEQTAAVLPAGTEPGSYLSADGACIELVLSKAGKVIGASPRIHLPVSPGRSASLGAEAVGATECFLVVPDGRPRNPGGNFIAIGLAAFLDMASSFYG